MTGTYWEKLMNKSIFPSVGIFNISSFSFVFVRKVTVNCK